MNTPSNNPSTGSPPETNSAAYLMFDGPYQDQRGPGRQNLKLWLLMLPQFLMSLYLLGPEILPSTLTVIISSLFGCLLLAPDRRRAVSSLDWFINAWLVADLSFPTSSPWPLDSALRGLICGLVTAASGRSRFLVLPGSVPLASLGLAFLLSRLKWLSPALQNWPIGFQWAVISWPEVFILLAAFIIFNRGRSGLSAYLMPWLAGLISLAAIAFFSNYVRQPENPAELPALALRLAALLPVALLIAPRLAGRRLELLFYELTLVILFFTFPLADSHHILLSQDPAPFLAALILFPFSVKMKKIKRKAANSPAAEAQPGQTARIKCGHIGLAPRPGSWLGPSSCRLANEHDEGQLLCPYGCLGLGDCARACPAEAIKIINDFAAIDQNLCQGCGRCLETCPKGLIELDEEPVQSFIPCASKSSLKRNAAYCEASCLGCGRCAKACPAGAIGRDGSFGAMAVDQYLCLAYGPDCGRVCAEACPKGIINP